MALYVITIYYSQRKNIDLLLSKFEHELIKANIMKKWINLGMPFIVTCIANCIIIKTSWKFKSVSFKEHFFSPDWKSDIYKYVIYLPESNVCESGFATQHLVQIPWYSFWFETWEPKSIIVWFWNLWEECESYFNTIIFLLFFSPSL